MLFSSAGFALAAPCDLKPSPPAFIRHDLTASPATSVSYCELCGYGYVTVIISNPYVGNGVDATDMVNMTIVENLMSSGLTYDSSAPTPMLYSVDGLPPVAGVAPAVSGVNGSILTWTAAEIPPLSLMAAPSNINNFSTIAITFAVKRDAGLSQEGLVSASRQIEASLNYSTSQVCDANTTMLTGANTLPLREPIPSMTKLGRNVDANQGAGSYTATVYGNINDDVIWRIQVDNAGLADLQDMLFDDVMLPGNIAINYACPSEAAASAIAAANGAGPGGLGCVASSNSISDFLVDNPFGTPNNDSPDLVDAPASSFTQIYLVGKISSSCAASQTNTVSNLRWGCTVDAPAGGITATSTGVTPASSIATLSTLVGPTPAGLNVTRQLTGTNTAQPVGSKGTMTITITNNTGGTIKNILLRDVLPVEYVMDSTFTPTVVPSGGYGNYNGRTDRITWTNPVAGTVPLTSTIPADPLGNTQPEFTLYSSTVHPDYADQLNMLRVGETLTITFRVVLIRPASYDKVANLDVTPEITGDGTDPTHVTTLSTNSLYLTYEDFCNVGTINAPTYPYTDNFAASPEDMDVSIPDAVYILTNTQTLTLPVIVTNNGGHDAADYHVFVSFGATMEVTAAPAGCSVIAHPGIPSQPDPWKTWILPASIPSTATVYECVPGGALSNPLAPSASSTLNFNVIKTSDAARLLIDDLSFRADVVGEITLSNTSGAPIPLWFPTPTVRTDGQTDRANNYSLDAVRARVIGFNLTKNRLGNCSENITAAANPDTNVQIGEECTFHIESGGWFGFQTPGFTYIAVQNVTVTDELPNGQGYISNDVPVPSPSNTAQINNITLTAQTSPPLNVLDQGWIDWEFNPVPTPWPSGVAHPNRITQKDEWFYANVTNRILNDPLTSGAPNSHLAPSTNVLNSTFEAVFNNASTLLDEVFTLGQATIGYPLAAARTVTQTVTEPLLTVTKRVCNETLYGTGPTCSNFVTLASNGDTYDTYVYRVTVTNGAAPRAPAYDVTLTDVLDPSDLAYIIPFAGDGLDNDGDGLIDAADLDGESSISDNIVKNGTPATITISHAHSAPLLKINPGSSVTFYYRVDPDQDVQPFQTLTNSVTSTYDSLAGASGAQTVVQSANNTTGGARVYNTAAVTARVRMITPVTQPKTIVQLSQANHAVPAVMPVPQPVSVGEEIRYELHTFLPIANLRNFVITDNLPAGVRCIEAPVINLGAAPYSSAGFVPGGIITPTCTDTQVRWDFGTQALTNGAGITYYDFGIGFTARVENTANTNSGNLIRNGGTYSVANAQYTNSSNTVVTLPYANADILVQEPAITLSKTFSQATPDASDVLTVTVNATNANTANTATAYNLRVMDDLAAAVQLTYLGNVGGLDPPDVVDTTTLGASRPIFIWNSNNPKYAIAPGVTRSFTYQVRVDDSVAQPLEPHEIISSNTINRMYAKWDSLPGQATVAGMNTVLNASGLIGADGSATGLRNGVIPGAGIQPNDYETSTFATLTVPALSVVKTDLSTSLVPAIGTYKNFQIDINLPEGTTQNVTVTDNLAVGSLSYLLSNNLTYPVTITYTGIATVNGGTPITAPADNTTGNAIWNFGTVITANENDPTQTAISPRIRISYWARIDNITTADVGDTLRNSALLNYHNGNTGTTEALTSSPAQVTVVEPVLTLAKAVSNITSPASLPDGGDILEYTLTLNNTGNSTAFDINLVDTLPVLLNYYASFTPTATIGGVAVPGFVPVPTGTPAGPLIWGRGNADGSIDLPAGQTLIVTYRVIVMPAAEPNTVLSNSVYADWTSLNGVSTFERTGAGCPAIVAPNDHCVGPGVATTTIANNNSIAKTVIADSYVVSGLSTANDSIVRIGDTVTYRLSVNIQEGRTRNVTVSDLLPAGMAFDSMASINGDTTDPYTSPATGAGSNFSYAISSVPVSGQTGTLVWNFGTIDNNALGDATTDTLVIEYRARVLPDAGIPHVATTTLGNTASLSYTDGNNTASAPPGSTATITVVQPIMSGLNKTEFSHVSGSQVNATTSGDIMNFTLTACNATGLAPAYSVVLTDTLAAEFNNASLVAITSALKLQPDVYVNATLLTPVTDYVYTPPPADAGSFTVSLNNGLNPGECVYVRYYIGFDDVFAANAWNNTVSLAPYWSLPPATAQQYNALTPVNFGMNNVATLTPPTKALLSSTGSGGEVTIGDELVYRITLPGAFIPGTLFDVMLTDVLNPALVFVSATSTVGGVTSNVANSGTPSNVILNLGDVDNQAVVDITVRVNNSAVANAGTLIDNTASFTYAVVNGGVSINGGNAATVLGDRVKIVEPLVGLVKTVANITKPGLPPDAGDVLRYTLTINAAGGVANDNYSNAFDISIIDTLGLGLLYSGNPLIGGIAMAAPTQSGNGITTPNILNWNLANDITEGSSVIVTYDVVVLNSVLANQALTNSAVVQWTSLNGANANERNGSNSPTYNDYFTAPASAPVLTTPSATFSKIQVNTTYGPGAVVRIGDLVDYRLRLSLPEGTASSVVLTDALPAGLGFESIVSITATGSNFTYTLGSVPTVPQTGTLTFNIGNIVNAGDNNTANDNFDIVYRARVLNNVLVQGTGAAQTLTNNASVNYTRATGASSIAANASLTVQQPLLNVSKSTTAVSPIAPGDTVQYTVVVTNNGTGPAYDLELQDVIPAGMRAGGITMVSPALAPTYVPATGVATWNFDTGVANAYTIAPGATLTLIYTVQADAGLSAGVTMTNRAQVVRYCSFDDEDVPTLTSPNVTGVRQCYSPVNEVATTTLYSAAANSLAKVNYPAGPTSVAMGQQFTYRITVPATPQTTALYDVRILDVLDDLSAAAADISLVSVTPVLGTLPGPAAWTPVVTGAPKNLVITTGVDIPANQQIVVDVTVVLNDNIARNSSGKSFVNAATYTYNQFDGVDATQVTVATPGTATRTIVGPDTVSMTKSKSGTTVMRVGTPGTFTLDVHNTGSGTAWDMTVVDILPNPTPGGMCSANPAGTVTVQVNGIPLTLTTDYTVIFSPAATPTTCTLTLTMTSAAAAILPNNHLIATYQASLDADNYTGISLTNLAGATQWFSYDTVANLPTSPASTLDGEIHTYAHAITDGTPSDLTDPESSFTITTESADLEFRKTVFNVTTGGSGASARPGDVLRYTVTINNVSTLPLNNFTLTDELDRLNTALPFYPWFDPGTLALISVTGSTYTNASNASGGSHGTGLLDIRNLSISEQGGLNPTITVVFEARLAAVITNYTAVLNQAQLPTITNPPLNSDDLLNGTGTSTIGDEVPTPTVITSAPVFRVQKTSLDISGDPLVLLAGERLRYTITVKNIGNENAANVSLRDQIPANTTYVAGSTQLNGVAVPDIAGASPLQGGMLINAPENSTSGAMRADASATVSNVATITFEVQISSTALNGTIISNQGFVNGNGMGGNVFAEKPSDNPATAAVDDPTINIVGNLPLLRVQKTVAITPIGDGILNPLEVLRYTITVTNLSAIPATGVILTDLVPANTTYVADTVMLNGAPVGQPDGGISPLIAGISVNSPASVAGTVISGANAVITFDVRVNGGVATGTVISNQGNVTSTELPNEPTDADGNSSNGYQPTTIVVGSGQQVSITKQVSVVGGGAALPGGQLEYIVRVTNTGSLTASSVVLSDDLAPLAGLVTYVAGSATLNGLTAPVVVTGSLLTAAYGDLLPGASVQLRFRVLINNSLVMGTTITNTGRVTWNIPSLTATASASIDVGGIPGSGNLNGHLWHDSNFDNIANGAENNLTGWLVEVYRGNVLLGSTLSDALGLFSFSGLTPTSTVADQYTLRFNAPGAMALTAKLGRADSVFTNGMQQISGIVVASGSNLQNLNLPIDPNGVLYNSILRTPVAGVSLTMLRAGSATALAATCFDDPVQQGQVTQASGFYKFELNFSDPSCPSGADYLIQVTTPLAYLPGQSLIIPPLTDASTVSFSVPSCPLSVADAIPATGLYCESQTSEFAPALSVPANTPGTNYYLQMALSNAAVPGSSQIFNNHIALDPRLDNAVTISKIASLQNVTRGQLIPYTITVTNTMSVTLTNLSIVDSFPPGFKYVPGSGRLDGVPVEPSATATQLTWGNLQLATNTKRVIQLMLIVGSGVKEGKYVNRAQAFNTITTGAASPVASATVRVIPDPTLDCSDVIGKVFDDANLNGYQDEGEEGLPGVRVVTARGLIVTADKFGRFHITCAVVPDPDRGSNFILKVDDRTLPSGYRITTENPRVQRATRGKMLKFNFGAAIHKVVKLDMADAVFEPGTTQMRVQWKQRIELLLNELRKAASVLRLSYLAETEKESLVDQRLQLVKREIEKLWKQKKGGYDLAIETEVFWRTGAPPEKIDVSK